MAANKDYFRSRGGVTPVARKQGDPDKTGHPKKRPRWAKAFLASLRRGGTVRHACEVAHISRQTAYDLRNTDAAFAHEWTDALDDFADRLERLALKRILSPRPSDIVLIFMLKAARPGKYRERPPELPPLETPTEEGLTIHLKVTDEHDAKPGPESPPEATLIPPI